MAKRAPAARPNASKVHQNGRPSPIQNSTALVEVHIRNFAIIDDLKLHLNPGLNIVTGETGAGKSIIIDALGLLLGDRATTDMVRAGADRAEVEGIFRLAPANSEENTSIAGQVLEKLTTEGLDDPDAPRTLILSREVRLNGRNIARINGRAVSLQILSEIASLLVDVHGQGEHLNLLRPRTHVYLLDRYANTTELRARLATEVGRLNQVRAELTRLRQSARTIAQRLDLLKFQVEEIGDAQLVAGEESDLEHERQRLSNAETLLQLAQTAGVIISEGDGESPSTLDIFSEAVGRIERLARIDGAMQDVAATSQSVLEQIADLGRELQDYADALEFNPERLAEVEERIHLIENLKRKYGDSIDEILAFAEEAQTELEELDDWEVKTASLEAEEESLLQIIADLGQDLSQARRKAGEKMAARVVEELTHLRMAHTRFAVEIEQRASDDGAPLADGRRVAFDSTGIDRIEFLISANPGEPLKPMAKVASGGETARLMLALKSALASADETPILIFDEIDQGIGGRVGAVVGEKLWRLTGQTPDALSPHQVLCITHLPQLAAFGDLHLSVDKRVFEDEGELRTQTVVRGLEGEERVQELMQMLGATTSAGRSSVEEMLAEVQQIQA